MYFAKEKHTTKKNVNAPKIMKWKILSNNVGQILDFRLSIA